MRNALNNQCYLKTLGRSHKVRLLYYLLRSAMIVIELIRELQILNYSVSFKEFIDKGGSQFIMFVKYNAKMRKNV